MASSRCDAAPTPSVRVLVVDDDPEFGDVVSEMLLLRDWETVLCHRSADALVCIRRERPQVVLLDLRMESPESGWAILSSLGQARTTGVSVIICSADTLQIRQREAWLRERGIAVLHKPFDMDELYERIEAGTLGSAGSQTSDRPS